MHAHSGSLKVAVNANALDEFTRSYITAALWSSTDDDGTPLDGKYSIEDIAPSTLEAMVKDCQQFQQQNAEALEEKGDTQGGHDFWLTRNGHGAGFWDGDWPENGKALTLASKKFGEADLYVGDDGYIYQYGKETPGPVPPREEYNPTPEDLAELKSMGIQGSKKTAVYVEEQWEDILQKKVHHGAGISRPETTDISKFAAGDMTTGKALKLVERLGNELKGLYFEAKPVTEVLDSRPVREAVEAIYRAYDMIGEASKVLNKQHMQEQAEEQALEVKEKNKGKKSSSILFGLTIASDDEDDEDDEEGYWKCANCEHEKDEHKNSKCTKCDCTKWDLDSPHKE